MLKYCEIMEKKKKKKKWLSMLPLGAKCLSNVFAMKNVGQYYQENSVILALNNFLNYIMILKILMLCSFSWYSFQPLATDFCLLS